MRSDGSMNSQPGPVVDDFLVDVADAAVGDAALQDDRLIAECQPDVVKGIQVERKRRFDEAAAAADFLDRERLEDHDFAMQLSENLKPLAIALVIRFSHVPLSVWTEAVRGKGRGVKGEGQGQGRGEGLRADN